MSDTPETEAVDAEFARRLERERDEARKLADIRGGVINQAVQFLDDYRRQHQCGCGHPHCNRCEDDREAERIHQLLKDCP